MGASFHNLAVSVEEASSTIQGWQSRKEMTYVIVVVHLLKFAVCFVRNAVISVDPNCQLTMSGLISFPDFGSSLPPSSILSVIGEFNNSLVMTAMHPCTKRDSLEIGGAVKAVDARLTYPKDERQAMKDDAQNYGGFEISRYFTVPTSSGPSPHTVAEGDCPKH